ncbi:hypothetical protein GH714_008367 [Hevea brasiliensis]|uniref:Thioredoxin domain-containing protein n=1 Tax=Hevea brasiliensis TaxID=3981 RepID=A0A6A6KAC9_HEVBR|nr:hypothetical protein GH714_008367 [Hevea brasiliensis]
MGGNGHEQVMKSRVVKVESEESWDFFISQGCPIVVHFTASWCMPSVAMNPFFEELALTYQDILFLTVDVDEVKVEFSLGTIGACLFICIEQSYVYSVEIDGPLGDCDAQKESGCKKRQAAILIDAVRRVSQLRGEAQKLKDSNSSLQEKIKELKAEKNELRDEKQRLKAEKEKLEQQLKAVNAQPSFLSPPPAIPATFATQGQAPGNKLVPFISYPGIAMWQFMPPAAVDTSQDHVLRPPVA